MSSSKITTPNLVERIPLATPPSTPVLRVKRRRSQSPAGALKVHLSAKKRKETSEDSIISSTSNQKESPKKESAVFKFTATLDNTDHDSLKIALNKADRVVKTDPKLLKRIGANPKDEKPTDASEKRYRIISNFRGIKTEDQEESERLFKLVDVIKDDKEVDAKTKNTEKLDTTEPADQITCNGVPLVKLAEEEYVYDVYTMQSDAMSSTGTESDDTINPDFDTMDIVDISFLDCRDMNVDEYRGDNLSGADSDSNDEDYWKNDYPDEDEFSDDDEAAYRDDDNDLDLNFENFHMRHGNREIASSPEESADEEELVFSTTAGFEQDANLYGTSYAKWKKQVVKDMGLQEDMNRQTLKDMGEGESEDDDINEVDEF